MNICCKLALLGALVLAGSCGAESDDKTLAGVYRVTEQTGSSASERPGCIDDSLTIQDVTAVTPGLAFFILVNEESYWKFADCTSPDDCTDYYYLWSPQEDSLEGATSLIGYSDLECTGIWTSCKLTHSSDLSEVRFELLTEMVFLPGDFEDREQDCFDGLDEQSERPCKRSEIVVGARAD